MAQLLAHGRHFSIAEATQIGIRIAKALAAGRDIKPDNLHLGDDHKLRILDLGSRPP